MTRRDLIRAQLRDETDYCSKDSAESMKPVIAEYRENSPDIQLYARGDSGFAAPELYDLFEDNDVKYAIRLKINKTLLKLAQDKDEDLLIFSRSHGKKRICGLIQLGRMTVDKY